MRIKLALMGRCGKFGREECYYHEVEATMPFQMFGYTFAAHPRVNPDGTFKDPKKYGWVVTETSSGAVAAVGDLRRDAIKNARIVLAEAGEEKTKRSIEYALDQQRRMA